MTNAIEAIHNGKLFLVGSYDCSINSHIFHHWANTLLSPQLPQNSIIVMDNATLHKRQDIQDAIQNAGHTILWLPPYSPDLNPTALHFGRSSASLFPRSGFGASKDVRIGVWIVLIRYSFILGSFYHLLFSLTIAYRASFFHNFLCRTRVT